MFQSSNIHEKELIEKVNNIEEQCDTCLKYKKPTLRPVVGLSIPRGFNHVVAVNVKVVEKVHILHIVDNATRLSCGEV